MQDVPLGLYGNSRSFDNSGFTFGHTQEQEQAVLRGRGAFSNMASLPEGSLQMLGVGHGGLVQPQQHAGMSTSFQAPLQHYQPY